MSLPIDAIKKQVIQGLQQGPLVVAADTGSGKSTRLPLWAKELGRVLVVEPRRIACTSLAEYLAQQDNTPLGKNIGYAIRFEGEFNADTQVVFVTPGVALRWFFENKLADFDLVMLDEFHERRWDTDLLLALLKGHNQHSLLLTSATLNAASIADYLGAETIEASGRMFEVNEIFYQNDIRAMPDKHNLAVNVYGACQSALETTAGDILVFLPGKGEIQQCASRLEGLNALIVPLHGGSNKAQQKLALETQVKTRIILATNVAETSLTIPNVTCVIDSGLERRTHLRGGRTVLSLAPIARDSAKQRLGRAGRVARGECIRLYGQHAPLEARTEPEIRREQLNELVLAAGCAAQGIHHLDFLDPLPEKSLQRAIEELRSLDAIDENLIATELGKRLYPLPLDASLAHLIIHMEDNRLRQAMIDLASILAVPGRVYQLPASGAALDTLNKQFPNFCDIELAIALVRRDIEELSVFKDALDEARTYSSQIRIAFDLPPLDKAASFDRNDLVNAIARIQPDKLYVRRNNRRGALGNGSQEVIPAKESRFEDGAQAALVMSTYALAGTGVKQAKTLATLMAPLTLKQVATLEVGETRVSDVQVIDNVPVYTSERVYAGVVIETHEMTADKDALLGTLAELILKGELFPGLGEAITYALDELALYMRYQGQQAEIPSPYEHILMALDNLGVESMDDLELLSEDDFAVTGIPEWEKKEFTEKFPLVVILPKLTMEVEYHFSAKRLTLHYRSGQQKDAPKRWELPAWPGFKIRYKKASKVVDIR